MSLEGPYSGFAGELARSQLLGIAPLVLRGRQRDLERTCVIRSMLKTA